MALDTPSSSAGAGPLADEDGPGALEAVERLEGSPPPEDIPQQPLQQAGEKQHLEPQSFLRNQHCCSGVFLDILESVWPTL